MGKKAVGYLLYNFLILATIGIFLLAVGGWRAPQVDPARSGFYVFLGLALPVVLFANLSLLVYWCVRRKVWLLFPLAALLLNTGYFTAMYQWPGGGDESRPADLKVASYNVHAFREQGADIRQTVRQMAYLFREEGADVVCLEEFVPAPRFGLDSIISRFHDWPHVAAGVAITIFSKYPILDAEVIPVPDTDNSALWVDLLISGQKVRVLAVHLQTTGVDRAQRNLSYQSRNLSVEGSSEAMEQMQASYRANAVVRAQQVARLRQMVDTLRMPLIVCGDFNDMPSSYTYRAMKGDLHDGFKDCGSGYGGTFRHFKGLLRIDYMFYNDAFSGERYYTLDVPYSDHKPVLMDFSFRSGETDHGSGKTGSER